MHAARTVLGLSILFFCAPLMGAQVVVMSWRVEKGDQRLVRMQEVAPGTLQFTTPVLAEIAFHMGEQEVGRLEMGANTSGFVSMHYSLGALRLAKLVQGSMSLSGSGVEVQR